jgi:hypothetical protein
MCDNVMCQLGSEIYAYFLIMKFCTLFFYMKY